MTPEEALKVFYKNRREKRFKKFKEEILHGLQEEEMLELQERVHTQEG